LLKLEIDEILKAIDGEIYVDGKDYEFKTITIDTRKIENESMFIALNGENFNANKFVVDAFNKGAKICIVDEILFEKSDIIKQATVIKVDDTKIALKMLAKYYRSKLNIKVIGVTGSTGKTSTKDLIAAALSSKYKVFKTKGNFNNEIGLPLMVFNLDDTYDVAVLEMGMSNLEEIHRLSDIARPDIAVITNVGISHIENLKTRDNILKAKLEITDFFTSKNVLIINADNDMLQNYDNDAFSVKKICVENEFGLRGINIKLFQDGVEFEVKEGNKVIKAKFRVDIPGKHNVLNALLAIQCGRVLDMDYETISQGFKNLEATSMRLDITRNLGFTIINDCYNASPDSMKAALDVEKNTVGKRKIAVLGTMRELGDESYKAHVDIGEYAKNTGIDILITVGEYNKAYEQGFNGSNRIYKGFNTNEEAANYIKNNFKEEDVILVKASRSMKFEQIVDEIKIDFKNN
jgi:UDP-N-acetylmuramoyl-tripeptide--D-alanyl-D-alanine ligase